MSAMLQLVVSHRSWWQFQQMPLKLPAATWVFIMVVFK
jgi:hypothetical protein